MSLLFQLFELTHLLFLFGSTSLGLIVGILPGLGGTSGLALILPFVFSMEPSYALAMMIGVLAPTTTSDTFPAVLMGVPGTLVPNNYNGWLSFIKKGMAAKSFKCCLLFLSNGRCFWSINIIYFYLLCHTNYNGFWIWRTVFTYYSCPTNGWCINW